MPLSPEDKLEMQEIVALGVQTGLSRIGLGADTEEELKEVLKDTAWTRERRKAAEDMVQTVRRGLVRGGLIGIGVIALYAVMHPHDFAGFIGSLLFRR